MATFAELTPEEQATYNSFMLLMRPLFAQWENLMRWVDDMGILWTNEVQAIHAQLDVGVMIPDNSGYPNSSPIVKEDMTAALSAIDGMKTTYHTPANSSYAVTLAGPENIHDPPEV